MNVIGSGLLLTAALSAAPAARLQQGEPQLRIVTSTTDLANIAGQVGRARVRVTHISQGYQDPHFVEAKPSFVLDLRKADLFAYVGLDLEIGWMQPLLDGARNSKILRGAPGNVDVSSVIPVIDVPQGAVDRSQGDVHPLGNPHYWLDPENGKLIARLFRDRMSELDPAGASTYAANAQAFERALDAAAREWAADLAQIRGKPVVAWHTSWRYFAEYTGMRIVGFMEPKPGVPPSASHLAGLILTMQRTGAKLIIMEPFYNRKTADFVASKTGAQVLVLPPSVGGVPGVTDYVSLMKSDIARVAAALQ
ncbi:MAG: metal ABC transporter substrate-binding protein [Gemmatimonadales bacterium]